jgi:hypothetical protein
MNDADLRHDRSDLGVRFADPRGYASAYSGFHS